MTMVRLEMERKPDTAQKAEVETLRKRVFELEQALTAAQQREYSLQSVVQTIHTLYALVDFIPNAAMIISMDGSITYANPSYRSLSGSTFTSYTRFTDIVVDVPSELQKLFDFPLSRSFWCGTIKHYHATGKIHDSNVSFRVVRNARGHPEAVIGVFENTENDKLWVKEQPYQQFVENAPQGILLWQNRRCMFANKAATDNTGYLHNEMLTWSLRDVLARIHPSDRRTILATLREHHPLGTSQQQCEIRFVHKSGNLCTGLFFIKNVTYQGKDAYHITWIDITERKKREKALQNSEELFRSFADSSYNWEYWVGPDGSYLYMSPSCERITGYSAEDFFSDPHFFESLVHPDDIPYVINHLRKERQQPIKGTSNFGHGFGFAFRIYTAIGQMRWLGHVFQPIYNSDGQWLGNRVSVRDITERIIAEDALRYSEERYRIISEMISDYVYSFQIHPDGTVELEWITETFARDTGYNVDEMNTPEHFATMCHPDDVPIYQNHIECLMLGVTDVVAFRIITVQGNIRWFLAHGQPVFNEHQEVVRIYGAAKDITEQKQAEQALQESEARFRMLAENAQDIIYRYQLTPTRGYEYINPSTKNITGYTPDEYYADSDLDLKMLHPESFPLFERVKNSSIDSTHEPLILPLVHKQGHKIWVEQRHWLVYDNDGRQVAIEGITRDITERKQAEEDLRKSEEALSHAHKQLKLWVNELEQHNRDATLLNGMDEFLQRCVSIEEVYQVVMQFVLQFFPQMSGAFYVLDEREDKLKKTIEWGDNPPPGYFLSSTCQALHRQRMITVRDATKNQFCERFHESEIASYICVPVFTADQNFGVLHLSSTTSISEQEYDRLEWIVVMLSKHVALTIANLSLRECLYEQSIRDPLTGLFNRRYMNDVLEREMRKALRQENPISILMLDVDHFKKFNDTYGHDTGDAVLKEVGKFLQSYIRAEDIACRYGGEEFTLILPGAAQDDTYHRADTLRKGIEKMKLLYDGHELETITISIGMASFPENGSDSHTLVELADIALYQAKQQGRNCVVVTKTFATPPILAAGKPV